MTTTRLPDWPERLDRFVAGRRHQPFAWGAHDCCLFVADAVREVWGVDPAEGLRGYRSERGAARILRQFGGVGGVLEARFGEPVQVAQAQVGDVLLVHTGGRDSLALCVGSHWLAPGAHGLEAGSLSVARAARRAC